MFLKKILLFILLIINLNAFALDKCKSYETNLSKAICHNEKGEKDLAKKYVKLSYNEYKNHDEFFDFFKFYLESSKLDSSNVRKFVDKFENKYKNSVFLKTVELILATKLYNESKYSELDIQIKKISKKYKYNKYNMPYIIFYRAISHDELGRNSKAFREYLNLWSKYPNFKLIKIVERKIQSSNKGIPKKFKIERLKKLFSSRDYKRFRKEYKPYNDSIRILRAQLYIINNNDNLGLKILNDISNRDRSKSANKELETIAEAKYRIALYNLKKFDDNNSSANELKNILLKFPNYSKNDKVAYLSAKLFIFDKNFLDSKKVYDWLIKTKSKKYLYDSYWGLAWSEYMLENYRSALNLFAYLEQAESSYFKSKGLYWKARCLEKLGNIEESQNTYRKIYDSYESGYYVYMASLKLKDLKNLAYEKSDGVINKNFNHKAQMIIDLRDGDNFIKDYQNHLIKNINENEIKPVLDYLLFKKEYNLLVKISYKVNSNDYHKYPKAFEKAVMKNSREYNVDLNLIYSLMREESLFDKDALSPVGAKGLMQLMDKTKQQLEKELKMKSKNPFIANNNIKLGTYYLSKLLKDFDGDLIRVIASYNAGPHNVRKWNKRFKDYDTDEYVESIPFKETHGYVKRVLRSFYIYQKLN